MNGTIRTGLGTRVLTAYK